MLLLNLLVYGDQRRINAIQSTKTVHALPAGVNFDGFQVPQMSEDA